MVKKSTLEKFSDTELKKYIAPESRFTPKAVQMALEILKERGHQFSDQESALIQYGIRCCSSGYNFRVSDAKKTTI
ncbi:hypothetical protein [Elizabethkingia ursingii]|uniref:hypothetical protein n=1 Tax=Elizabethkingia ursingii TaxID=1756150 RepID=UPI002011EFDB|nr:hypothetical protein [Elizabethkingia ursingii]MCL1672427.1 hypothetical protein [Elizabethkingia ursingii]